MEKRSSPRQAQDASIFFSRFNAQTSYDAKMLNYSRDGMYFETNQLLPEKTDIFFRVDLRTIDKQVGPAFARFRWPKSNGGGRWTMAPTIDSALECNITRQLAT